MACLLVCIDFSPLTDKLIDTAKGMARCMNLRIHLVHAQGERALVPTAVISNRAHSGRKADSLERRTKVARLGKLCAKLEDQGFTATCATPSGRAADVLIKEARIHDARMMVMGCHGNGAVHHLMSGSVAEDVLKGLSIPTVLVPG